MILKEAINCYYGTNKIKKIYLGNSIVYYVVSPSPPMFSKEEIIGSSSTESYEEGSITWGDLTLSVGYQTSNDGIEMQSEETYVSAKISGLSYPMSFEWKGRIDSSCYKTQVNHPGMLFGFGATKNGWGDGVTCYSTTDYGIIIDTTSAMSITTYATPTYAHIVVTINSSGNLTMYLNGIDNIWTCSSNTATKSNKNYIFNGEGIGRFVDAINTMRWWDIELSTIDIAKLFSSDENNYSL